MISAHSSDADLSRSALDVEALALSLVRQPSVNGGADEATFARFLAELLGTRPRIRAAGGVVSLHPISNDPLGRASVLLIVPGDEPDLILLTGHFDTVGVEDFGPDRDLAFDPPRLAERWRVTAPADTATRDVTSGAFLPGRGLLDMKSGIAAGIAALEQRLADPERRAHLAMILTPDEEDQSAGMRDMAQRVLPELLRARRLRPYLAINLDATAEENESGVGPIAGFGSMGKLLLFGFFVGKPTHACYPTHGVNAALMAAAVAAAFETSEVLVESGQPGAPPAVTLHLRDLKSGYDVTTPTRAFAYWNVIAYERTAREVLARAGRLAIEVLTDTFPGRAIDVTSFADLGVVLGAERDADNRPLPERIGARLSEWARTACSRPTLVLGFASTPYPACRLDADNAVLRDAIRGALGRCTAMFQTPIVEREYLPVISDLSFLAPVDGDDLAFVAQNTPGWDDLVGWPLTDDSTPAIPSINLGPWGRGYHSPRERVHRRYAFEVLPALLQEVLASVDRLASC